MQHLPPSLLSPPRAARSDGTMLVTKKKVLVHTEGFCATSPSASDYMKRRLGPFVHEEEAGAHPLGYPRGHVRQLLGEAPRSQEARLLQVQAGAARGGVEHQEGVLVDVPRSDRPQLQVASRVAGRCRSARCGPSCTVGRRC
eukprot:3836578-Prymnesium_polylepis.1